MKDHILVWQRLQIRIKSGFETIKFRAHEKVINVNHVFQAKNLHKSLQVKQVALLRLTLHTPVTLLL